MSTNMFEAATRCKFRFPFKGAISVEDLWDLSVDNLDSIFKTLNAQAKKSSEESLLAKKSSADAVLDRKIEIIKHIVNVKLEEAAQREVAAEKREQRRKIDAVLASKREKELEGKSIEELEAMRAKLDD